MICSLRLQNFRSYEALTVTVPDVPLVFLVGPNGAGKTNMLEALSLLSGGRGLRGAAARDFIRQGTIPEPQTPAWVVSAQVSKAPLRHEITHALMAEAGESFRRVTRLNQRNNTTAKEVGTLLPTVGLSPQEDAIFRGPAEDRRALLDRFIQAMYPDHRGQVSAFSKALRERNALLRQAQKDRVMPDATWLSGLEVQMASHGIAVAHQRRLYLSQLASAVAAGVGPFPAASLALEGEVEADLANGQAGDVEAAWAARWATERSADLSAGRTLNGPHRTDLAVVYAEKLMPAGTCSTGEQKALLLSLFLGQARLLAARGVRPLLLLDEVAAHLDEVRRKALMAELSSLPAQTWMTGTDWSTLDPGQSPEKTAVFHLEKSALRL